MYTYIYIYVCVSLFFDERVGTTHQKLSQIHQGCAMTSLPHWNHRRRRRMGILQANILMGS